MAVVGDVVWLKSGGQPMTVTQVSTADGVERCRVAWMGGGAEFQTVCLSTFDPSPALNDARRKLEDSFKST
jgi:uncharacterized protein YodC (DUF2158 family)